MSFYLSATNISKSYGFQRVLQQVSLMLSAGQRMGLVGANGVGKSTLLKIIAGEVMPDDGMVSLSPGFQIGYLAQVITGFEGQRIDTLVMESMQRLRTLERQMRQLEQQMTHVTGSALDVVMATYGEAADCFERYGGYDMDHRVEAIFAGLRIGHISRDRLFATLSGGEKSRVGLAIVLLQAPDVLLLDEPTNHLDFHSLEWLEGYLQAYKGAMLIVSHDRQFLNRTVNVILEIDEHTRTAKRYTGDYDAYYRTKQLERRKWEISYAEQQEEVKALRIEIKQDAHRNNNNRRPRDGDKFIYNFKRATHDRTVAKRVRSAEERLKRILDNPIAQPPDPLRFEPVFEPEALKSRTPLQVYGVCKGYGERKVLDDVTFSLDLKSRVVLVGANGSGKSTLLKILMGLEQADSGEVFVNPGVQVGYLAQEQHVLNPARRVFEAYQNDLSGYTQQLMAILLQSGLFRYDDLEQQVGQLSAGQQRKLQIAQLMAGRANLLILDEPTNDVSFDVLERLEEALVDFPGPIIAASHDRRFIQRFNGMLWALHEGRLLQNIADFETYLRYVDMVPVK